MTDEKPKVGVGVGVMILKNNQVLLGKRHGDPAKATSLLQGAGTWTMPGENWTLARHLKFAPSGKPKKKPASH